MSRLKTVDFSKQIPPAERMRNLPEGYQLYSPYTGPVRFRNYKDGCVYVNDNVRGLKFWNDGTLRCGGECMLYPSKDIRDCSKFYAPAKDEVVHYGNNNNPHVHIAGKWFRFTATSDGKLIEELDKPCYIAEEGISSCSDGYINRLIEELQNEKGLVLNLDTLEWSEAEKEYTLSDGSKATSGDVVVAGHTGYYWQKMIFVAKTDSGEERFECISDEEKNISHMYEYALPIKGNEWRIGGNSKLEDTKPEPKKEIILSDGSIAHEGDEVIVSDGLSWEYAEELVCVSDGMFLYRTKDMKSSDDPHCAWHCLLLKGNENILTWEYFRDWHIGKLWPSGFRTGQPVLKRLNPYSIWEYGIFSHEEKDGIVCIGEIEYVSLYIPYHGNETLVGTNKQPKEK